jgi:hypothetical protein
MTRLLVCLALCLVFGLLYHAFHRPVEEPAEQPAPAEALRPAWLAVVAADPGAGLAGLPWAGLVQLGAGGLAESEPLPDPDPVAFLEKCLRRYDREVKGYSLIMQKQERVAGTLKPKEVVEVHFREKPFSVFMKWLAGARKAQAALYVEGENDNQILVRPTGFAGFLVSVVKRPLDHPDVKASGRYGIEEFGLQKGTERTLGPWQAARARGQLHVAYEGVYRLAETGGRPCYKLHRTRYERPEDDGITDLVLYIDMETWLQTGSVLRGEGGRLIGEYYFRDIRLNPRFAPDQFTAAALKR